MWSFNRPAVKSPESTVLLYCTGENRDTRERIQQDYPTVQKKFKPSEYREKLSRKCSRKKRCMMERDAIKRVRDKSSCIER